MKTAALFFVCRKIPVSREQSETLFILRVDCPENEKYADSEQRARDYVRANFDGPEVYSISVDNANCLVCPASDQPLFKL